VPQLQAVKASINYTRKGLRSEQDDEEDYSIDGDMSKQVKGSALAARKILEPFEMNIYDARPALLSLTLDRNGFCLETLRSKLPSSLETLLAEDERDIRAIYWPEVEDLAKKVIRMDGRPPKYVFAIGTQKFTEDRSRGFLGSYSRQAHADFSDVVFDNAYKMLVKRGVPEEDAKALDIMFVNSWQPFGHQVNDNALTILDWTSIDTAEDVVEKKRGSRIIPGHIYTTGVEHNPQHRWMYVPKMQTNEVWLFKQADSRSLPGLAKYAFHTAFKDPTADPEALPRRSLAIRLILAFEKGPASAL